MPNCHTVKLPLSNCQTVTLPICHTVNCQPIPLSGCRRQTKYHTVTLSYCHTVKLSNCQAAILSICHTIKLSSYHTVKLSHCQTIRLPHYQAASLSNCRAITLSDCRTVKLCQATKLKAITKCRQQIINDVSASALAGKQWRRLWTIRDHVTSNTPKWISARCLSWSRFWKGDNTL